jgi:CheY-like chemotaxis protein
LIDRSELTFENSPPPQRIRLRVDRIRMTQCLVNVLNNAVKFTPPGGRILLQTEMEPASPGEASKVILRIRDTGVGIPPDKVPMVFDLFYQADTSIGKSQTGLGIGLTLVRRLLELHGGSVAARSAGIGQGSEFELRLPVLVDQGSTGASGSRPAAAPSAQGRILIADDNLDAAESLALLLRRAGCEVRTAHDGAKALELAHCFKPDTILLDLGMPKMTGHDVAARIRESDWGSSIILVAVTGWGQEEERRRTLETGFDAHLVKPVDHTMLFRLLVELRERVGPLSRQA